MRKNLIDQLTEVKTFLSHLFVQKKKTPSLLDSIADACQQWQYSLAQLNYCDPDMIDYLTQEIMARERYYILLLNLAKKEGKTAWPEIN